MLRMGVDYHLPCSFENSRGTEALPVLHIELPVHVGDPAVTFHDEMSRRLAHKYPSSVL